jgi:hypothetical protein
MTLRAAVAVRRRPLPTAAHGRVDQFTKPPPNDRNLRSPDGWSRREADIADRAFGRDSWADSGHLTAATDARGWVKSGRSLFTRHKSVEVVLTPKSRKGAAAAGGTAAREFGYFM